MAKANEKPIENNPNLQYNIYGFRENGEDVNIPLSSIKNLIESSLTGVTNNFTLSETSVSDGAFTSNSLNFDNVTTLQFNNSNTEGLSYLEYFQLLDNNKDDIFLKLNKVGFEINAIFRITDVVFNNDGTTTFTVELYNSLKRGSFELNSNYSIDFSVENYQPDYDQTDDTKGDYIKNKPTSHPKSFINGLETDLENIETKRIEENNKITGTDEIDLSLLTTTNKDSIKDAINENKANIDSKEANLQNQIASNDSDISALQANQNTGVVSYTNLADLPITGVVNVSYKVTNDSVNSNNNGYYTWNGSAYVKDASLNETIFDKTNNSDAVTHKGIYDYLKIQELRKRTSFKDDTTFTSSSYSWIFGEVFKIPKSTNYSATYIGYNLTETNKKTYIRAVSKYNHIGTFKGSGGTTLDTLNWTLREDGLYEYVFIGDLTGYTSFFLYFTDTTLHSEDVDVYFEEVSTFLEESLEDEVNNALITTDNLSYLNSDNIELVDKTLNLSNGSTSITDGFSIPIGQTGNDTYWLINPKLFIFDSSLKVGNIIKYNLDLSITNYTEVTQPQTLQIIEQKFQNGSQISTKSAIYNWVDIISGSTLNRVVTFNHKITQDDIDNGYYYKFYVGFKNTNTVTSIVNVTVNNLEYINEINLDTKVDRNKKTLSRRVLNPQIEEISVNRDLGRTVIQNTIDSHLSEVDIEHHKLIKAEKGVYETIGIAQFIYFPELDYYNAVNLRDYINLEGIDKNENIINCTIPDNLGSSFPYEKYQGVYIDSESNFKKFSVIFGTGRYALHIDGGFAGRLKDTKQLIEDCLFWHKGNTNDAFTRWGIGTAFGHGSNSGQITTLKRCVFRNPNTGLFIHNNYDFEKPSITTYEDCEVISDLGNGDGNVVIQNLGSGVPDVFELKNTNITQSPFKLTFNSLSLTNLKADTADIEVITDLEPRAIRNYDCKDMCLRIDSLSTGSGSYVLLDRTSTAYDDLFGDSSLIYETINRYGHIYRYGYSRKTGNQGLSGFAYGDWNIKEDIVQGVNITSLGKRLGDCSTTSKILTLNVDGVNYNISFNSDYTSVSNSDILLEINTSLTGVAIASEFKIAQEYYPKFKGVEIRTYEDSSEAYSGYGVVFTDDNKIRKALNSDGKIDGILLDDVATGETARIITCGRINRQSSLRFQLAQVSEAPLPKPVGNEVGISSTAGVFESSATPKLLRCYEQDVYKIL